MSLVQLVTMSDEDHESLRQAVGLLEFPTFADRVTSLIGRPIEKAMKAIPQKYQHKLADSAQRAIQKAFEWVLYTVDLSKKPVKPRDRSHKLVAAGLGAVSGFAGGWVFLAELPLTTGVLLRTIADIARHEGEDLSSTDSRLACVEVFALDTVSIPGDHAGTSAYYALRKGLASVVAEASVHITQNIAQAAATQAAAELAAQASTEVAATVASNVGAVDGGPVIVRLMNEISRRFGVTVSQEFAAGLVPVIGAVSGAAVNFAFTDHFQRIAHGHFTVRRLERIYGHQLVEAEYAKVRAEMTRTVSVL